MTTTREQLSLNKQRFVRALAEFLVADQALMSIRLQTGDQQAVKWQTLRSTTPLFGYPTVDEATAQLTRFLA